jgi:leukotriene-A4 hydrolase
MAHDYHSFAKPEDCALTHAKFDLNIDFENKVISGIAYLSLKKVKNVKEVFIDTKDLDIISVNDISGKALTFELLEKVEFLGRALRIELPNDISEISIRYKTTTKSSALQWLSPEQTKGKKYPFLFTQGQAILSRTWIPVQDSPGIRFTWEANISCDKNLLPVMSGLNPQSKNASGNYHFEMNKPVPAYLIALAVGNLDFKSLGPKTGVYSEPEMLEMSAFEFSDMEAMLQAAEALYGEYKWGRYDVIVLPPSFPFGGMENPMLTFATPTILAGDKSLTSLIAHELAHSWSGNLVTNQTWDDFWLNEGFTVYFERRIMESLYGKDYADMLAVLGYQDLIETITDLGNESDDTKLKLNLKGRDADDGMTDIAYEKGCLLLLQLEKMKGRQAFDKFLNEYFNNFAFKSISTEEFLEYISERLALTADELSVMKTWIYQPGIPGEIAIPSSSLFENVDAEIAAFVSGKKEPVQLEVKNWSSHEWLHFLRNLPGNLSLDKVENLDDVFEFTASGNSEIKFAWLMKVIPLGYKKADKAADEFLLSVGRRKFVLPMFKMLAAQPRLKEHAKELYSNARLGYHSVTAQSVDEVFN